MQRIQGHQRVSGCQTPPPHPGQGPQNLRMEPSQTKDLAAEADAMFSLAGRILMELFLSFLTNQ